MKDNISSAVILAELKQAAIKDLKFLKDLKSEDEISHEIIDELINFKNAILELIPEIGEGTSEIPTTAISFKSYSSRHNLLEVEEHNMHFIADNTDHEGYPKDFRKTLHLLLKKYENLVYRLKNDKMKGNLLTVES